MEKGIIQLVPKKVMRHRKGRPVTIPIHPELLNALNKVKGMGEGAELSDYVMPQMAEWYVTAKWKVMRGISEIFKAANITMSIKLEGRKTRTPEATFHSLRHTFVSLAANAGVPLHIVQSIVGHESTAMTRHYYHEDEEVLRRAVAAIPSLSLGLSEKVKKAPKEKKDELRKVYELLQSIFG